MDPICEHNTYYSCTFLFLPIRREVKREPSGALQLEDQIPFLFVVPYDA